MLQPCVRRRGDARHARHIEAKSLEQTVAAFEGNLAEVRGVVCDVRDYADVERAAQATIDAFGKVHLLCNNAGVSGARGADD